MKQEIQEKINMYDRMRPSERRALIGAMFEEPNQAADLYASLPETKNQRGILRILSDASRKKRILDLVLELEQKEGTVRQLLKSDDPKTRKNAGILLGTLKEEAFSEPLIQALSQEQTEYVRSSLLLALGRCGGKQAESFLLNYTPVCTVKKHLEEEMAALKKAVSSLSAGQVSSVPSPRVKGEKLVFFFEHGLSYLLEEEFDAHNMEYRPFEPFENALASRANDFRNVLAIRTFSECMIYLKRADDLEKMIELLPKKQVVEKIRRVYPQKQLNYRLSIFSDQPKDEKTQWVNRAVNLLDDIDGFLNSPSSYFFEIKILVRPEGCYAFLKPSPVLDTRFSYRKNTLPASIHPVAAAAIMQYCYPYMKRDADVLDPFCGTGTLLVERARVKPFATLTGSDISNNAIHMAKENLQLAQVQATLTQCDACQLKCEMRYDEVVANLPFGHRVGTHEDNLELYHALLKQLPALLKPKGMAFLYTNDKSAMTNALHLNPGLTLVDEVILTSGNISASLYLISLKKE